MKYRASNDLTKELLAALGVDATRVRSVRISLECDEVPTLEVLRLINSDDWEKICFILQKYQIRAASGGPLPPSKHYLVGERPSEFLVPNITNGGK